MPGLFKKLTFDNLLHERELSPTTFKSAEYQCPLVDDAAMFKLRPETINEIIYGPVPSNYDGKIFAPVGNRDAMLYPDQEYRKRSVQKRIDDYFTDFKNIITNNNITDKNAILQMWNEAVNEPRTGVAGTHIGILHPTRFKFNAWFYPAVIKDLKLYYDIKFKDTGRGQQLEDNQDRHTVAKSAASLLHDQHFHPYFVDGIIQKTSKKGREIGCLTQESYNELTSGIERAITSQDVDGDVMVILKQMLIELSEFAEIRNIADNPDPRSERY